jgi:hypothetical protein
MLITLWAVKLFVLADRDLSERTKPLSKGFGEVSQLRLQNHRYATEIIILFSLATTWEAVRS